MAGFVSDADRAPDQTPELQAERDSLRQALWTCARESGADLSAEGEDSETVPAHATTENLIRAATEDVRQLRRDYEEPGLWTYDEFMQCPDLARRLHRRILDLRDEVDEVSDHRDGLLSLVQRLLDHGANGRDPWVDAAAGALRADPRWLDLRQEARAMVAKLNRARVSAAAGRAVEALDRDLTKEES